MSLRVWISLDRRKVRDILLFRSEILFIQTSAKAFFFSLLMSIVQTIQNDCNFSIIPTSNHFSRLLVLPKPWQHSPPYTALLLAFGLLLVFHRNMPLLFCLLLLPTHTCQVEMHNPPRSRKCTRNPHKSKHLRPQTGADIQLFL